MTRERHAPERLKKGYLHIMFIKEMGVYPYLSIIHKQERERELEGHTTLS
jgi:hypothetical protein